MNRRLLLILGLAMLAEPLFAQPEMITAGEYFFDNAATAEGAGTPLTIIPGTDPVASAMESIDVSGLSAGAHVLYLRFQDDAGTWGNVIGQSFVVPDAFGLVDISGGERFFDTDPGQGSGTTIAPTGGVQPQQNFVDTADVTGVGAGSHTIGLRVQDTRGEWSANVTQSFVGRAAADYRINTIVSGEFFFDTDPGLDLASPLLLTPLDPIAVAIEGTDTVDVNQLSQMPHTLSLRVSDDFGMFSNDLTQSLNTRDLDGDGFIDLVDVFPLDMTEWRDTDLDGIGNNSDPDIDGDGTDNELDNDIDGDGIPNDDETLLGLDPRDHVDGVFDIDRDGLSGLEEYLLGTDPTNPDTDGDSVVDGSDPTPGKLGVLDAVSNPGSVDSGDLFGASVAACGNIFVVGSPQDEGGGSVHVYRLEGASPMLEASIPVPDGFTAAEFGASVACEGDTLVVGAPGVPAVVKGTPPLEALQAAIFQRTTQGWNLKDTLTGENPNGDDSYGSAVAISAGTVVVGAPDDAQNETAGSGSGAVYVYGFSGTTASLVKKQKPTLPSTGGQFGAAVAASGGAVAVGAPMTSIGAATSGAVTVFQQVGSNLNELGTMTGTGSMGDSSAAFGASVSMAGGMVAVGAPGEGSSQGAVYVFNTGSGTLSESGRIESSDTGAGDGFGSSVSLSGDDVVIGSPGTNSSGAVFQYSASLLLQRTRFDSVGSQTSFGTAVSVSGDRIIIGAPSTNNEGAASLQRDVRVLFGTSFE